MKIKCALLFLFVFSKVTYSQIVFERQYSSTSLNSGFGYGSQLLLLPDSGYMFVNTEYTSNHDSLLIGRLDKVGNVKWVKQVGDNSEIYNISAALSTQGLLYVTYSTEPPNTSYYCSVVIEMDLTGNIIWSKAYGEKGISAYSKYIFVRSSSLYIIGENTDSGYSEYGGAYNLYFLKLDTAGNFKFGKALNAGGMDYSRAALQLKNSDILISGLTTDSLFDKYESLFRVDTSGNIIWEKRYHVTGYKEFNGQALNECSDGSLIITGHVDSIPLMGFGKWDISLMKLSSSGNFYWAKFYGGTSFDEAWTVMLTNDKGYMLAAEPESYGGVSRIGLLKTDSLGNFSWMRLYGESSGGFPNNTVKNYDQGYTIFATNGSYNVDAPMLLIRTDSSGNSTCTNTNKELPQRSFVPIEDSVLYTSNLSGSISFTPNSINYPLTPIDLCSSTSGIANVATDNELQVYPDPFDKWFTTEIKQQKMGIASFELYDINGNIIYSENKNITTDDFSTQIRIENISKGIYFLDVRIGNERITTKLIKQ